MHSILNQIVYQKNFISVEKQKMKQKNGEISLQMQHRSQMM